LLDHMPDLRANSPAQALVASPDQRMAAELKHLLGRELPQMRVTLLTAYPPRASLVELVNAGCIELCFLDIAANRPTAFEVMSHIGTLCPDVPVLALLPTNDPDLILQCLRQGASEFLIQPFTPDQLHAALAKLSRFHLARTGEPAPVSRVYCVVPSKGACGATTVACHLAPALKRQGGKKVLLADMDGLTGTVAFLLKLKSQYSFVDALSHAGSLEADVWKQLVTSTQGVDVLLSPENPVESIAEIADPSPIVNYARRAYDTVVLDAGGPYGEWNLTLARAADEVLLIATSELATLNSAQRASVYLENNGTASAKIRLVINRHTKEVGLRREAIEQALQCAVFETLPNDYETIQRSLLDGKPAAPGSGFGKSMVRLAAALAGPPASDHKNGSSLTNLLRKLSG